MPDRSGDGLRGSISYRVLSKQIEKRPIWQVNCTMLSRLHGRQARDAYHLLLVDEGYMAANKLQRPELIGA
jgi:hypothetical protein